MSSVKFGIDGYFLPRTVNDKIKVPKWNAKDFKRFADYYSESRKWVPPPNTYDPPMEI